MNNPLESNTTQFWTAAIVGALAFLIWWYRHTYGEKRTLLKDGNTLVRVPGLPIFRSEAWLYVRIF